MENLKYHYTDNWYGHVKRFSRLKEAKKQAVKDGGDVHIFCGNKIVTYVPI